MNSRKIYSLDSSWHFRYGEFDPGVGKDQGSVYGSSKAGGCPGVPQPDFSPEGFKRVDLPHDWSVTLPFDENGSPSWGYKPKGKAWYRRQFLLGDEHKDKRLIIEFDGVAKDCEVYFNGSLLKRHHTAYAPFSVDITDRAFFDGVPNTLAVFVDADGWEGWWYEGAGIYRHVRLISCEKISIAQYGIYASPRKLDDDKWECPVEITLENTGYTDNVITAECEIKDLSSGSVILKDSKRIGIPAQSSAADTFDFLTSSPKLWDIETPNLYECTVRLDNGDERSVKFGFRTLCFDAQKGFFLNGRSVKLYGSCNHQDHGGIGVAIPDSVHEYRIKRLKEMGTNAYRCAHGMPHSELLDVCDREGMLVMDENRSFETSEESLEALRTMILRDRNHPSVIMWSIFNEEPLQGAPQGKNMARKMRFEINRLDRGSGRAVTGAMNGGVENGDSAAQVLDVAGINYQLGIYDAFHKAYPDIPVVGTETTSAFSIRGCYETDPERHLVASYDDESADWGNTVRETWQCLNAREFACGGFMWTGFDYLGEPTPYTWGSVSSFFGMMDVCGFAKDAFYLCKAIFSQDPVIHLLPHWDHVPGETVTVMSCTNCEEAELFLNGVSLGRKPVDKLYQQRWQVVFQPGELKLVGFNGGKEVCSAARKTPGKAQRIIIEAANVSALTSADCAIVNFTAVDSDSNEVSGFCEKMEILIEGGGLVGASNGDPNCHEAFDSYERSLFNAKAQAIIRPNSEILKVKAKCGELESDELIMKVEKSTGVLPALDPVEIITVTGWRISEISKERPDPLKEYAGNDMNSLKPYLPQRGDGSYMKDCEGKYVLLRAYADIPESINGKSPAIHFQQLWGQAEIYLNGKERLKISGGWGTPADIELDKNDAGKCVITLIIKCTDKNGGGLTADAVIR